MEVCTAVAKGDLARARVVAESLGRHQPDARFVALVVDDPGESVSGEPYEIVRPEQLGVESLEQLYRGCGPRTLGLALRPWLLSRLLDRAGASTVVWVGPETRVMAPIDELDDLSAKHGVLSAGDGSGVLAISGAAPARDLLRDWTRRVIDGVAGFDGELESLALGRELERLRDAVPSDPEARAALRTPPPERLDAGHTLDDQAWAPEAAALTA